MTCVTWCQCPFTVTACYTDVQGANLAVVTGICDIK